MDVAAVAKLANIIVTSKEEKKLASQFEETLITIDLINELDTAEVEPTSQVTGLTNVTRQDVIDQTRILPPPKDNFYIVPAIFHE